MPKQALTTIDQYTSVQEQSDPCPLDMIFQLRTVNGLSERQIAKMVGKSKTTVHYWIKKHNIPDKAALQAFKATRGDRFAAIQKEIAENIDLDDIKKASLLQKSTTICQLYDKERLERDLSTSNVSVLTTKDYDAELDALDAEYRELSQGNNKE